MYPLLRALLFRLPTEMSHHLSLDALQLAAKLRLSGLLAGPVPNLPTTAMGIRFPNPVGLAAGLDKNGDYIEGLVALGFGFIEIGTVTPRAQPGNPQPRLFRLPQAQAIVNRMGFNNRGVDYLIGNVERARAFLDRNHVVLGINIGKNKDTPAENAVDDYLVCMRKAYAHAAYIAVNLSSPNTPGLRDLQFGEPLKHLLAGLKQEQHRLATQHGRYVPVAVKIAPDMAPDDIRDVAGALLQFEIDGVIATNTTIARAAVKHLPHGDETGGLSGAPLTQKSNVVIRALAKAFNGKLPIIGVGGIMSGRDAVDKIDAGAALVQIYSGLIYRGPSLVGEAVQCCGNRCMSTPRNSI